jgi:hypothetical protein
MGAAPPSPGPSVVTLSAEKTRRELRLNLSLLIVGIAFTARFYLRVRYPDPSGVLIDNPVYWPVRSALTGIGGPRSW